MSYTAINPDIGAAETINRLLRVADQKELARNGSSFTPVRRRRIIGTQQQQDLSLQRIGILELIHENALETRLKGGAHFRVIADEISRLEQ
jgi:hypothetical protein